MKQVNVLPYICYGLSEHLSCLGATGAQSLHRHSHIPGSWALTHRHLRRRSLGLSLLRAGRRLCFRSWARLTSPESPPWPTDSPGAQAGGCLEMISNQWLQMSSLEMISNQWSLSNIRSCWKKATASEAWTQGDEALCCPVARNPGTARDTPAKSLLLNALGFTQMKLHCLEQRPNMGWGGEVPENLSSVRCWQPFTPGFAVENKL